MFLTNEMITKILRSEHERIFKHLRQTSYENFRWKKEDLWNLYSINEGIPHEKLNRNPSVTTSRHLEEIQLCQEVIEAKTSMGLTIYPYCRRPGNQRAFDRDRYERQLKFIATTLIKHPMALAILDLNLNPLNEIDLKVLRTYWCRFIIDFCRINGKRCEVRSARS